jgi:organic radical activating enzyme
MIATKKTDDPSSSSSMTETTYFADLQWFYTCNYNCSYCLQSRRPPGKAWKNENVEKIIDFFDKRQEQWHIKIIGGEPTIHPLFVYLCEKLTKKHIINVITNASLPIEKLEKFVSVVKKEHVSGIACSLQPVDEDGGRREAFYCKVKLLKDNGYNVSVSYVAAPDRIKRMPEHKQFFEETGIRFQVLPLLGEMNGKRYPNDYSEEEFELLSNLGTIPAYMRYFLEKGRPCVYGKRCDHGHNKIIILGATGAIKGCLYDKKRIGNIYEGWMNLDNRPRSCQYAFCPCPHLPDNTDGWHFRDMMSSGKFSEDDLLDYYYKIAANPYCDGFNWRLRGIEAKRKSLAALEKAEEGWRMFYDAYIRQCKLYMKMGNLLAAAKAYKKAMFMRLKRGR